MDGAMHELIQGGLGRVDDYSQNGGVSMSFSGGKDQKRTFIVGNKVSIKLRDNILEWGAFKETYGDDVGESGIKALCNVAQVILNGRMELNLENTLEVLRMTYKLPDDNLSRMLSRRLNFGEPTKTALKSIFENWTRHLEKSVINYAKARNNHIDGHPDAGVKNDVDKLYKNWTAVDQYYNIETSSPILLYSKFPNRPYDLPWLRGDFIEEDVWDIYPDEFYWTVSGVSETNLLQRALDKSEFTYLGFCPRAPKTRLRKLFTFPMTELHAATEALGGKVETHSTASVLMISKSGPAQPTFAPPHVKRESEPSGDTIYLVKWYINQMIKVYMQMKSHFESVEKYYVDLARKLSDVGFKLEDM